MALANPAQSSIPVVPAIPRWAWPLLGLFLAAVYLVGFDQGAVVDPVVGAISRSPYLHEFIHDGRHLLSFPCH